VPCTRIGVCSGTHLTRACGAFAGGARSYKVWVGTCRSVPCTRIGVCSGIHLTRACGAFASRARSYKVWVGTCRTVPCMRIGVCSGTHLTPRLRRVRGRGPLLQGLGGHL